MIRRLPALLFSLLPLAVQAQDEVQAPDPETEPDQVSEQPVADLICLSVGGAATWTQLALYGADDTALVMAIPPEGDASAMESQAVTLPMGAFSDLIVALIPGLASLPAPPAPEECTEDALGPISIVVRHPGADALRYDAPCATDAILALNAELIAETGDPTGEEQRSWTAPALSPLRDTCRDMR